MKGAGETGGPCRGAGGRLQGRGGPRDRPLRAAGSRVAISRAGRRPRAHKAARPTGQHVRRPEHQRHHKQHSNTTTRRRNSTPRHTKNRHPNRMSACGGARGIRTPDLLIANETRYQLRHSPKDSNSLAPSQSAVQADHRRVRHDTVMEPNREPCRQRDSNECAIANTPRRKTPPALHTRASETTVPTAPTCDRAASQVARGAAATARSSPIGPCAHPGRRPGRGRRSDRRRPLRSSGHRPGRSGQWGERGSPP